MPLCGELVVEGHAPFRRALGALAQGLAEVVIVGEAADGVDAIHQATAPPPGVITPDIGLPDAAIQLERLRDAVSRNRQVDIQYAYPMAARQESARAVTRLCAERTVVEIRRRGIPS